MSAAVSFPLQSVGTFVRRMPVSPSLLSSDRRRRGSHPDQGVSAC